MAFRSARPSLQLHAKWHSGSSQATVTDHTVHSEAPATSAGSLHHTADLGKSCRACPCHSEVFASHPGMLRRECLPAGSWRCQWAQCQGGQVGEVGNCCCRHAPFPSSPRHNGSPEPLDGYVKSCATCAAIKPGKPPGLLQQVAGPSRPWEEIAMDFVVELPEHG